MKNIFFLLLFAPTLISCKKPIEYQFTDSPETIHCEGLNYDLAHEAYYSFRQDIAIYMKNLRIGVDHLDYRESLGYYIYRGAMGNFDYTEIVTPHTREILKELKKNKDLWDTDSEKSNLNYNSEFINCLIQGIKNEDVKQTILSLREANTINSDILKETYRINVYDSYTDNNFGMLIAFDTYYQHFLNLDFNKK